MGSKLSLEALIAEVAAGDRAAFRQLYEATASVLLGVALRVLRNKPAAEDAVQEAYLRVWRSASSFDPAKASAATWLAVIVRRAAIDRIKRDRPLPDAELMGLEILTPPIEAEGLRFSDCLNRLPETHRNALVLMYVYGLTHTEVAARLDAPLGTVKSWIRRAVALMKECLRT